LIDEVLIRQLFHIRQKGTATEYVEEFSALNDQLATYESEANPLYYTMCFVDGLQYDIRSMVMIQRPPTYDSACALALVQEEVVDSDRRKEFKRYEPISHQMAHRPVMPLPLPLKLDKGLVPSTADGKRSTEAARAGSPDDKVQALKQYQHARGLCDRCAEKWVYGHKCSSTVQLHAIQELLELFPKDCSTEPNSDISSETSDHQLYLCLSELAVLGVESNLSMKFMGNIHGKEVPVLLDSGSSATFLSSYVTAEVPGQVQLVHPLNIRVANGTRIQCHTHSTS
jgi:hypothetical protein